MPDTNVDDRPDFAVMPSQILGAVLNPAAVAAVLLVGASLLRHRKTWFRILFCSALAVLLLGGNAWIVDALTRSLERQYAAASDIPSGDIAILIDGGIEPRGYAGGMIEINQAGDRLLQTAQLYREGKVKVILCTGGGRPALEKTGAEMDDGVALLVWLGVPREHIWSESSSRHPYELAAATYPLLKDRGVRSALLVTSAVRMRRTLAAFRRVCADVEIQPVATDFRAVSSGSLSAMQQFAKLIPCAEKMALMSEVLQEYAGLVYYRIRGWA